MAAQRIGPQLAREPGRVSPDGGSRSLVEPQDIVISAAGAPTPRLLERERELAFIDGFLGRVARGKGGRMLVVGPAGIGKSALLDAAGGRALDLGMAWLSGRASEVAPQVGFGVARSALGALWPEDAEQRVLEATPPAAELAHMLLAQGVAATLDLAEDQPALLSIDDLQWADLASLRWLASLSEGLANARLGLLLTVRSEAVNEESAAFAELIDERGAVTLRPAALSERAAAQLLSSGLDGEYGPEIIAWCNEETGGNPYLLHALVDGLRQSGIPVGDAARERLREIGSRVVARNVTARLERLSAAEQSLARGVAVVGDLGGVAALADVLELDAAVAADAAHALVAKDLLRSAEPPELAHPLIGAAIREQLDAARGEQLARRAASRLLAAGLTERAAAHLLPLPPRGDAEVTRTLSEAARLASSRGAADVAATLLRRALAEPPPRARRAELGHALGEALLSLGSPDALTVLEQALGRAAAGRERAKVAAALARALSYARRLDDSVAVLEQARAALGPDDADLAEELDALAIHQLSFNPALRDRKLELLQRLGERRGASELAHRCRLAELASESLIACQPAPATVALAQRALAGGVLLSRGVHAHQKAVITLAYAGQPRAARAHLHDAIALAQERGDRIMLGFAMALHGEVRRLEGEVLRAEVDARTGLELLPRGELGPRFIMRGLIESLVDQGRIGEAEEQLRQGQLTAELPEVMPSPGLIYARARVRVAAGALALGLEDLLHAGAMAERLGLRDPVSVPWRPAAAETLLALGERSRAAELVAAQLELARQSGVREAVGAALRLSGRIIGGRAGRELLDEAVEMLEAGFARLELATALVDLGAATSEGDRVRARELLERGATLAEQLGAAVLATRAAELAAAAGGRPRRPARRGPESLSAAERRTARLAAEGLTNREIAQTLVLSEKTVESQLRAAFRKLGIRARGELRVMIGGSDGGSAPEPSSAP